MNRRMLSTFVLLTLISTFITGCQKPKVEKPDYDRALPPGQTALRLVLNEKDWPNLATAYLEKHPGTHEALKRSEEWFKLQSTKQFFPLGDVTHLRAQASTYAFRQILESSVTSAEFEQQLKDQFNCYTSVGYDNRGSVLYTGYYTPIFKGSKTASGAYPYPLYNKPDDLISDPITGEVKGRKVGNGVVPYPTRTEIESTNMLKGTELVYVATRFEQYVIQVNGSAKIELDDGGVMYIGYAGSNGQEYTGLGQMLKDQKILGPGELNLPNIKKYFDQNPQKLEPLIAKNDRYTFFKEYTGDNWPAGSLGFKATPYVTLATDKSVFPRGAPVVVVTNLAKNSGGKSDATVIMADQDTGGAIRAAGRGDIYYGIGPAAETLAGAQFSEGRLYYFFLKHQNVLDWYKKMRGQTP